MESKDINQEKDKVLLDINNIELFLINSGYLNQKVWKKNNSDFFEWNKVNEILISFEFNEKITATEASVKYGDKIQWINKIFKNDNTLDEFHSQYCHYTSSNISFIKLLNNFILLEIILKNFYNIINKNNEENINNIFSQQIIMNDIDLNSSLNDKTIVGLKQKLESIYVKINKNPSYKGKDVNYKLISIIFLLSMGSSFSIDKNIPNISNLMNLFTFYNILFINDINLSFILFLSVIISINLCIYANKKKSHFKFLNFDKTNYNNFYFQEINKRNALEIKGNNNESNDDKKNYISLFLFDNDIINYTGDYLFDLLMFQNYLKLFSIYHLSKNQIKLTINLTIETLIETLKTFNDNVIIDNINNTNSNNINININTNNILKNKTLIDNQIKTNDLLLLSQNNLTKCFSTFNFNELFIKTTNFKDENEIREINTKYLEFIQKSKKLYFINSISTINQIEMKNNNSTETIIDNTSLENLTNEFKALKFLLHYYHKNKEAKKYLQFYCFKFRFFKCSIFRESKKEIQLIFDYSSIKERILLNYLKDIVNILFLIKEYENVINAINEFKLYTIIFRVCQTDFRSQHLNFFFTMIIKKLVYYIEEKKYNRITIYDSKLNAYHDKMFVYIKDESMKIKSRINTLKELFNQSVFNNKFKGFNSYLKDLAESWDIIIIGEDIKYHNLLYSKNLNILFLNIVKEENDNSIQDFMDILPQNMLLGDMEEKMNNKLIDKKYINIFMYIINDEDFADKILKFAEELKGNNNVLKNKITIICERFFFEENIIMNSRIKDENKQIFNFIDNYYLICDKKKNEEIFKYDLYITINKTSIVNHVKQEINKDFSQFINNFISTLSSCVELILYILKNKEIEEPTTFFYLQRIKKDYYFLEYTMSNIFIQKLKVFDSLLLFNPKNSIPLFFLLSEKQNNDSDMGNSNCFLDLFLRLFLNLNKVVENNKLNEVFFEKIHKNMFYQNYDIYKIMAFSFEAFCTFNDLFINNNYFQISKNDKFEMCYILPYEIDTEKKIEKFKKIMEYQENDELMVKKIKIYDYQFTKAYIYQHSHDLKMDYQKIEFFFDYHKSSRRLANMIRTKMMHVYKKLIDKNKEKKNIKKIFNNIKELYYEKNNISYYNCKSSQLDEFFKEYNTEQIKISVVKVDI